MEQFWAAISLIGEPELWIFLPMALLILYFIIRKVRPDAFWRRPLKAFLLILIPSMTIVLGTIYLTKLSFPLERPCTACLSPGQPAGCNPYCEGDASFPSGHAGASLTAFTIIYLLSTFSATRKKKLLNLLIFIIPALILASRVSLGVHTITDVLVGGVLGLGMTLVVWVWLKDRVKLGPK